MNELEMFQAYLISRRELANHFSFGDGMLVEDLTEQYWSLSRYEVVYAESEEKLLAGDICSCGLPVYIDDARYVAPRGIRKGSLVAVCGEESARDENLMLFFDANKEIMPARLQRKVVYVEIAHHTLAWRVEIWRDMTQRVYEHITRSSLKRLEALIDRHGKWGDLSHQENRSVFKHEWSERRVQ